MLSYSVAIRTLGLNPQVLRAELESVFAQIHRPERVVIYIAEGYSAPDFRIADEQYVSVPKGMVAQRAVDYAEIDTPLVMLLDDDVILSPDSAEKLVTALETNKLDCISPDTFANHKMSLKQKVYAAFTNLVFPHRRSDYAFRIRRSGSFSYVNPPVRDVYMSQSAGGPCSLWRRDVLLSLRFRDELWLDRLGFAFNDDFLEYYKLYVNGGRLGIHFDCGVRNADAQTYSSAYHRDPRKFMLRGRAMYLLWYRSIYSTSCTRIDKMFARFAFWTKTLWLLPVHCIAAVSYRNIAIPYYFVKGTAQGHRDVKRGIFRDILPYRLNCNHSK